MCKPCFGNPGIFGILGLLIFFNDENILSLFSLFADLDTFLSSFPKLPVEDVDLVLGVDDVIDADNLDLFESFGVVDDVVDAVDFVLGVDDVVDAVDFVLGVDDVLDLLLGVLLLLPPINFLLFICNEFLDDDDVNINMCFSNSIVI
jgi:hypothetical protein